MSEPIEVEWDADQFAKLLDAAVERGRQQGWREGLEQAARNAEGQPDTAPELTPRQVAAWLRLYASSFAAPTEGSQTSE